MQVENQEAKHRVRGKNGIKSKKTKYKNIIKAEINVKENRGIKINKASSFMPDIYPYRNSCIVAPGKIDLNDRNALLRQKHKWTQ